MLLTDPLDLRHDTTPFEVTVGAYRFQPATGRLTSRTGITHPLGRRATRILSILAENAGQDVSTGELLARVWPGQIVDAANVAVQISGLRAVLGDTDGSVILTVHGRGYRLAFDNRRGAGNIPHMLGPMTGRETELANAGKLLLRYRLLVITGLTGTGKTRLACATARSLAAQFPDGQWMVPLGDDGKISADRLTARIATTLTMGGQVKAGSDITTHIGQRSCLLLLDGCEGLDDDAFDLVRRLVDHCPHACVLMTSHLIPRRLKGFCVRLSPLPAGGEAPAAVTKLFLDMARAAGLHVSSDQPQMENIEQICRHMGGVPLGLEIAAKGASLLGLDAIATASRNPMRAMPVTRRPGPVRHQSVRAAMGWSYHLLSQAEQAAIRYLADQTPNLGVDEAAAGLDQKAPGAGMRLLAQLHEKSLLERMGSTSPHLTLNPLVRAYAQSAPEH